MSWSLVGKKLSFGSQIYNLEEGNRLGANQWIPIRSGVCRIQFNTAAHFEVNATSDVVMRLEAGTQIRIELNPLISLQQVSPARANSASAADDAIWSFVDEAQQPGALESTTTLTGQLSITLSARSLLQALLEQAELDWAEIALKKTQLFARQFLRVVAAEHRIGQLSLSLGKPVVSNGRLTFPNNTLELEISGRKLTLRAENLALTADFRLCNDGMSITTQLDNDFWIHAKGVMSLKLFKGTRLRLDPALINAGVTLLPEGQQPAMRIYIPDIDAAAGDTSGTQQRFELDFKALPTEPVSLGPAGLRGVAQIRPKAVRMGSLQVAVEQGEVRFNDGWFDASIDASAKLPYFESAHGTLSLSASSKGDLTARWTMAPARTWTDPSGYLKVVEPSATVEIDFKDGQWQLDGSLAGTLELARSPRFLGDAKQWLGRFAEDFRLGFTGLKLTDLQNFTKSANGRIALNSRSGPGALDLWGLFKLELSEFALCADGFDFSGTIGFSANGLGFAGRLPRLRVRCKDGIAISRDPGEDFSISGRLSTPGGVKAELELRRVQTPEVEELAGTGALAIPGFPAVSITCALGRRAKDNAPLFLLFVAADFPITLFPGVVLRNTGLGLGINKVFKEVQGDPSTLVERLVSEGRSIPDPSRLDAWEASKAVIPDLSLVAQTYLAPSPYGDGPFPYVGRAMLYVRPTVDLVMVFGANLWLFTSLRDAATTPFQKNPALTGALVLYPRHGFVEMQVVTRERPMMSDAPPFLQQAFSLATCEFYLKASRDEYQVRAGPLRVQTSVAGLNFQGQTMYAVRLAETSAIAVCQISLAASVEKNVSTGKQRFGPLTVQAGFSFSLQVAFETIIAGMVVEKLGAALYGRARLYALVEMSAWVSLQFALTIRVFRFKKTISWSKTLRATFRLSIDIRVEMVLARSSGFHGEAILEVRLFGYRFKPKLEIGSDGDELKDAREHLLPTLNKTGALTGP